jgi:hypothetical protein
MGGFGSGVKRVWGRLMVEYSGGVLFAVLWLLGVVGFVVVGLVISGG